MTVESFLVQFQLKVGLLVIHGKSRRIPDILVEELSRQEKESSAEKGPAVRDGRLRECACVTAPVAGGASV